MDHHQRTHTPETEENRSEKSYYHPNSADTTFYTPNPRSDYHPRDHNIKHEEQGTYAYDTPRSSAPADHTETPHGQRYNHYVKNEPALEDSAAIDPALFGLGAPAAIHTPPTTSSSRHTSPTTVETKFETPPSTLHSTPEATPSKPVVVPETPRDKVVATSSEEVDSIGAFKAALERHFPGSITGSGKTLIVQSPLSYKHTFGRDWLGKKYRDSLVERPERLRATSLGIAAAIAHNPKKFEIEESVREASLDSEHVVAVHGAAYVKALAQLCYDATDKLRDGKVELPPTWPEGDIYLSPETINALRGVVGAIERGVDALYDSDVAQDLQGLSIGERNGHAGTSNTFSQTFINVRPPGHHCHACDPSGFCLINNAHVAIQYAAKSYGVTHAVILDFDLHHGDGSQDICWSQAETATDAGATQQSPEPEIKKSYAAPSVGYFSVHDINSFPTELGFATPEALKDASTCLMGHGLAIWNVHLQPYETEEEFWELYRKYGVLFEKANEFLYNAQSLAKQEGKTFRPLVVLSSGFDASEHEGKGMQRHSVNVPVEFYHRFSKDSAALSSHYSGRLISLLEGGYSDAALSTGVWSHLTGLVGGDWSPEIGSTATARETEKVCRNKDSRTRKGNNILESLRLGKLLWPDVGLPPAPSTRSRRPRAINQTL